jgi:hypothetical protein
MARRSRFRKSGGRFKKRAKLSRGKSRRLFTKTSRVAGLNGYSPMRGGFRL